MTGFNEYISHLDNTPLDKLTDIDIDFAIDYFSDDLDGYRFNMEKRRRALIEELMEMMSQPLTKKERDVIVKRLKHLKNWKRNRRAASE